MGHQVGFGRAVSRILSAADCSAGENHLSQQPYPEPVPLSRTLERAAPGFPIWPCTRWGFPCPADYSTSGGLLHHLFTFSRSVAGTGSLFSVALSVGTTRAVTARVYPKVRFLASAARGYAASRPVVFGLSSPGLRRERFSTLPKPLARYVSIPHLYSLSSFTGWSRRLPTTLRNAVSSIATVNWSPASTISATMTCAECKPPVHQRASVM